MNDDAKTRATSRNEALDPAQKELLEDEDFVSGFLGEWAGHIRDRGSYPVTPLELRVVEAAAKLLKVRSETREREAACLHACEGLDTADLAGNERGWLSELVTDAARFEAEHNRMMDALCVGNVGCDLKVRCQSYEASEQNQPCHAGRCVMAQDASAPRTETEERK